MNLTLTEVFLDMKIRRSKFLTVIFSLIPGAGHMFMGFMKRGVSLMSVFILLGALAAGLGIGFLGWIMPIIWFYSFFDCINLAWAPDEVFNAQTDDFMPTGDFYQKLKTWLLGKHRAVFGAVLVFIGIYLLIDNVILRFDYGILNGLIHSIYGAIPRLIVAGVIIFIGVRLIMGKRKELDSDE